MLGKGAFIALMGFFIAFSVYQLKMTRLVTSALGNFTEDYQRTQMHHDKLSALNMGISKAWHEEWVSGDFYVVVDDCSSKVSITQVGLDTLKLKVNSWAHVYNENSYGLSSGTTRMTDSVTAYFRFHASVSEFFWFTESEGVSIYWTTVDTIWGPFHTNGKMLIKGSPTFFGKVTCKDMNPLPGEPSNDGNFLGGWELGVTNSVDKDFSYISNAAIAGNGGAPTNSKCIYDSLASFTFLPDGKVVRSVGASPADTVLLTDIAPTGVIYSTAEVRVQGALNGELTIYTTEDIYLDDDMVLADDPLSNPSSDDILGLVSESDIIITDNPANNSDINIIAAMMAVNGSFKAENHNTRPVAGSIYLTGSVYQFKRGPVGTFNKWGITHGFAKNYRFDDRLYTISPPQYPYIKNINLVGWWE